MEDRLVEELVVGVGEVVGDAVENVIGERTWVYSLWRFRSTPFRLVLPSTF